LLPFQYQWRKDGIPLTGATASRWTIFGANANDAGDYDVMVSNVSGSTTSAVAKVTVILGPSLTIQLKEYVEITINGMAGHTYGIEYTTDLSQTASWINATNLTLETPIQTWVDVESAMNARRFYHVIAR
ncbi:MAG TPA: hypothetical protein VNU68_06200, partial [Verrucomicrobiae bacterium]|nr:hypothetical protein [Verrucomicrobiae bacterium]